MSLALPCAPAALGGETSWPASWMGSMLPVLRLGGPECSSMKAVILSRRSRPMIMCRTCMLAHHHSCPAIAKMMQLYQAPKMSSRVADQPVQQHVGLQDAAAREHFLVVACINSDEQATGTLRPEGTSTFLTKHTLPIFIVQNARHPPALAEQWSRAGWRASPP